MPNSIKPDVKDITPKHQRTLPPKVSLMQRIAENPVLGIRLLHQRSYYAFLKDMWSTVSNEAFEDNWHIKYLCDELQRMAEQVGNQQPKNHDLIVNIPPGTSKTTICSIFFPVWCWTRWYWMQFICLSYSASLSLESAEKSRDIVRSDKFRKLYPELSVKEDKDTKGNFRVVKTVKYSEGRRERTFNGGNRLSTSVEGTVTGFHAHMILIDDPINPQQSFSPTQLSNTNRWLDNTLPTRKIKKEVCPTILIMQRLHENDPTGHMLKKGKVAVKHICLPGDGQVYKKYIRPIECLQYYVDGLLDVRRLSWKVLKELEIDLGQYGYSGQVGQNPTPPAGGMFKTDKLNYIDTVINTSRIIRIVRYWDKAGTKETEKNKPAYTVGAKLALLTGGIYAVLDIRRGRWASNEREAVIKATAIADGEDVEVFHEQEPGSGGKESAEATNRNLAGFSAQADRPRGDKIYRADPFSVQVNDGNVALVRAEWNKAFIDELKLFPFSQFKDQVDAAGGAFSKLAGRKQVKVWR